MVMAKFEQLPAQQQTILELVINRRQSYEALSVVFDESPQRIRELAHEGLARLAPFTYSQLDEAWQPTLADYVLGQQAGDDMAATRAYLAQSEAGRAWVGSMLDSLDDLFEDARPEIPEGNGSAPAPEQTQQQPYPEPKSSPARVAASLSFQSASQGPSAGMQQAPPSTPQWQHDGQSQTQPPASRPTEGLAPRPSALKRTSSQLGDTLSPAAKAIMRRRRIVGAILGLCVVIGLGFLAYSLFFTSSKPAAGQVKVLRQVVLNPLDPNSQNVGAAIVAEQNGQTKIVVQAKLNPPPPNQGYEVWLYNSSTNVVPLGFPQPNQQGIYQGVGNLPPNYGDYHNVDISLQNNGQQEHSGNSVLRGSLDQPPPPAPGAAPPQAQPPPSTTPPNP